MTARAVAAWVGAALVATMLGLTGCAGLPTDDQPRPGEPVLGQPRQVIQVRPEGPRTDASAEQIVRGFLLANVSFEDSHEVARTYLTDDLASSWVPTSEVLVFTGENELSEVDEGVVEAKTQVRGVLDAEGDLTERAEQASRTEEFGLTRVGGQWRISEFPQGFGLWLSTTTFEAQFRTASVSYLAPDGETFVPSTRWFSRDDGLPTALTRALLAPVPAYLEGVVETGIAEGTNLVAGAVPLDPRTGVATVNLQGPGLSKDPDQSRALYAQLAATLTQAGGVRAVQVQINGQPLEVPGVDGPVESAQDLGMAEPDPGPGYAVLRVGESLTAVDPEHYALRNLTQDRQEALELPSVPRTWRDLAMDEEATEFAALDRSREVLWRRSEDTEVERGDIGAELTDPTFDRHGSLWLAGVSASGPRVWAIDPRAGADSLARPMEADWLEPQQQVDAFAVAPDGQRASIVVSDGAQQRAALTGIIRDQDGQPTGLTPPVTVAPTLTSIQTLSWASQESLVALGQRGSDEEDTPYQIPVGSWLNALQVEPDATELLGVPTNDGFELFLLTDEGRVYTPEGAGWYSYRNGDDLIVPAG